jgi:hypothetical protein
LILFYLVFQVNFMSLAENWRKELTELANDRSKPAIVRPGERAPAQTNVRWANDRPGLRTCALEVK